MKIGVNRPDLTSDGSTIYDQFLNDAQREICRLHSFAWMRTTAQVQITGGNANVALPATFKELTREKTPVHLVDTLSGIETPVDIWSLEKLKRFLRQFLSLNNSVAIDWSSEPPKLSIGQALVSGSQPLTYNVSHYAYLTDLSGSNTSNPLTIQFPEMLLAKAKALAFEAINDPLAGDMETLFLAKFRLERQHDTFKQIAGNDLRM